MVSELFRKTASQISAWVGSPAAFGLAAVVLLIWLVSGSFFGYSDTWQLVINTATTIITFLMVFLIQNTQNRDNKAIQIKLDELLKGVKGARTSLVDIEDLPDEELERLHRQFQDIHKRYSVELTRRKSKPPA